MRSEYRRALGLNSGELIIPDAGMDLDIVLVERSATLSHLVLRTLSAAGMTPKRGINAYPDAVSYVDKNPNIVMLLGAPQRSTPEFEALLAFLKTGAGSKIPVLLLANEKTAQLLQWLSDRRAAQILLWTNFARIPTVIEALRSEVVPAAAAIALAPARAAAASKAKPASAAATEVRTSYQPTPVIRRDDAAAELRVLFIDDSQSVRFAYKQMLSKQGYAVDVAGSIGEGWDKAKAGQFDLVIVDYFLPDGTGDELCQRMKSNALTANTPIALITGTYKDNIIKKCLEAGAVECMFKNEVLDLSLARINALVRTIQVQKRIEAERQRLDGILASVGDGVYGVDEDGAITFINPMGIKLLGHIDQTSLIGKRAHLSFHFAAEDGSNMSELDSPISRAYASGEALSGYETVFWTRSAEALPVECSVVPLAIQKKRVGSVVVFRNISERKSAERLRWEMNHDALTGLANRRYLIQTLAQQIELRREKGGYSAVLYIDVDRFAIAEEQLGELESQRLLVELGQHFSERLREGDLLARLENDHFALLLSGVQLDNLFTIADGFRELVRNVRYNKNQSIVTLTGTVGVAILSKDTPSAEFALDHARVACSLGKRRGSDQTQIYVSDADARIARELDAGWSVRIREALHEHRFVMLCQPIVAMHGLDASKGMVDVEEFRLNPSVRYEQIFELLIRMVNRDGQWVSPAVFVPLAERVGLMPKIDLWVLGQARKHLRAMRTKAPNAKISLTVNLSNVTLQDPESIKQMEEMLRADADIALGSHLIFEVTETREIGSLHAARRTIQNLRKLGCRFALDDFGTGFSSISHLKHLPVDFVKVEGSFIAALSESETDRTMVRSITDLAHALGLAVIAEHVDSELGFQWLKKCGIDYSQGHFHGTPRALAEVDFDKILAARTGK
jgi:diguanylate cyclase (GGDEF)-like protein/PAS domain S-box-containing protein